VGAIPVHASVLAMEGTLVPQFGVRPSRDGRKRWGLRPVTQRRASRARAHPTATTGCSRQVEPGLGLSFGRGSSGRRSRPVPARKGCACESRVRTASLATSIACKGLRGSVSGFGPAHARGVETSMGVSTLRFVLQKSIEDVELREASLATCGGGERELAPSGRPRPGEWASEAGS